MKNLTIIKNVFNLRRLSGLAIFGCLFFGGLQIAQAQQNLVTFAQFTEKLGGQEFVFTNNGNSATFGTVSGGSPIDFKYLNVSNLNPALQGFQDAHLFLTSGTSAAATSNANNFMQTISNTGNTIRITRDTPAPMGVGRNPRTNLLTIVISPIGTTAPSISGTSGGNSATFSATTPDHIVTFTSNFLNFNDSTQRNLALSFSSVLPGLNLGTGGFLNSFAAAGSGTFASNPPPIAAVVTAAAASLSGRVLTPEGFGLRNAQVTLMQSDGSTRTALTGSFGYYSFSNLEVSQTLFLSVTSKTYQYTPQVVTLASDLTGINFFPDQQPQNIPFIR